MQLSNLTSPSPIGTVAADNVVVAMPFRNTLGSSGVLGALPSWCCWSAVSLESVDNGSAMSFPDALVLVDIDQGSQCLIVLLSTIVRMIEVIKSENLLDLFNVLSLLAKEHFKLLVIDLNFNTQQN